MVPPPIRVNLFVFWISLFPGASFPLASVSQTYKVAFQEKALSVVRDLPDTL
jgi:hypothetical protein